MTRGSLRPCLGTTSASRRRVTFRQALLGAVAQPGDALLLGAVGAAENGAVRLDAVADDPTPAMRTGRRERVDRALEAVEDVRGTLCLHLERLVVVVPADLADRHRDAPCRSSWYPRGGPAQTPTARASGPERIRLLAGGQLSRLRPAASVSIASRSI